MITFSPVRGRVKNDEEVLQGGVKSRMASREEIEAELAKWGDKIIPVQRPLKRAQPRRIDRCTISFGNVLTQ